jgi:hypothetical protein
MDTGKNLIPVEVKSGETVSSSSFEGLRYFKSLVPPANSSGVLIYGGEDLYQREDYLVRPWYQCL